MVGKCVSLAEKCIKLKRKTTQANIVKNVVTRPNFLKIIGIIWRKSESCPFINETPKVYKTLLLWGFLGFLIKKCAIQYGRY